MLQPQSPLIPIMPIAIDMHIRISFSNLHQTSDGRSRPLDNTTVPFSPMHGMQGDIISSLCLHAGIQLNAVTGESPPNPMPPMHLMSLEDLQLSCYEQGGYYHRHKDLWALSNESQLPMLSSKNHVLMTWRKLTGIYCMRIIHYMRKLTGTCCMWPWHATALVYSLQLAMAFIVCSQSCTDFHTAWTHVAVSDGSHTYVIRERGSE